MLGLNFYTKEINSCCNKIINDINNGCEKFTCVPVNVDVYLKIQKNKKLKNFIYKSKMIVADGMPLVFLSKIIHEPLYRITGADLMPLLCSKCLNNNLKVFILGGREEVNKKATQIIRKRYGDIIAGRYSPPSGFENDKEELKNINSIINKCKPHIIFVCFGAPKQEYWLDNQFTNTSAKFALCAGAAVDFIADSKRRAPVILQKLGLEWFYRLCQEPKRLFKRYLIEDIQFIKYFIKEIVCIREFNMTKR
jgi:N-acetylglucosaminyldiphosphoundecaprenol N-acetyl-beta-D-mannosaminyltransferase